MRPIRTLCVLAAVAFALAGSAPGGPTAGGTPAPEVSPVVLEAGDTTVQLDHDDRPRYYIVHVPEGLEGPAPLVLVLHHLSGTPANARSTYQLDPVADAEKFITVYPEGLGYSWNAGRCCEFASKERLDDVGFLTAVLDQVEASVDVDPDRVYATGFSNGAMMTYRLACETDRFAAIAPVAGSVMTTCGTPAPASVLHVHGREDTSVPFGEHEGPWREAGACEEQVVTEEGPLRISTAECPEGRAIELVGIAGVRHEWPVAADGYDTANKIWEFFEAHPAP